MVVLVRPNGARESALVNNVWVQGERGLGHGAHLELVAHGNFQF